jgi:hypothetical protein
VDAVLALGVSRGRLRAAVEAGTVVRLRRGVVTVVDPAVVQPAADATAAGEDHRAHVQAARAALQVLADDSVVSHRSAAWLHELPTFDPRPLNVWVTAPRHGRVALGIHRRLGQVLDDDRTHVAGLPCTSVARTALDLARRRPLHESLVCLDAALARTGERGLATTFARLDWRYDLRALSEAVARADARSESPLESISRGRIIESGLPMPELQAWLPGVDGRRYRVDFLWRAHGVVGEADGWVKYSTIEDVREEKRREDALRGTGLRFVRWTWDEAVRRPDVFLSRLTRGLA